MVSVSNTFKNAFTATTREIHAEIGLLGMYNGNTYSHICYEDDIFDLEVDYPFDADELPVYGHCLSASLKCRIKNPNMSTRRALMRAQKLMGTKRADVSIYTTQNQTPA